jgi:hypothetical protein
MATDFGIYAYWEGPRHWYYDLCFKTIKHHNPNARMLSRADVEAVLGPLPPVLNSAYVTHRVDWIRKAYIRVLGGLWLDMDFICLRPLQSLANLADTFDYVGYEEWSGNWMDNFFVGRRGSPFLATAADHALDQLQKYGPSVAWLACSADAIAAGFQQHPWCNYLQIPTHLISPVSVMDPNWFTDDIAPGDDLGKFESFGFITSFHGLGGWLNNRSEQEFMDGRSRLSALIRRALK